MNSKILNLLSLEITDQNKQDLTYIPIKKGKNTTITVNCILYVDDNAIAMMKRQNINRIYLIAITRDFYIAQQFVEIPVKRLDETSFIKASYTFSVPYFLEPVNQPKFKVTSINIIGAYSNEDIGQTSIPSSLLSNQFLTTTVPVSEVK